MANIRVSKKDLRKTLIELDRYFNSVKYPFEFSDDIWKDESVIENTNCYRYAFDLAWNHNDDGQIIMGFLGWSIGKFEHSTGNQGFYRFEIDLKRMHFKYEETEDDKTVPEVGYKIALFIFDTDFHFARQNVDGRWSDKEGFDAPVGFLQNEDGKLISPYEFKSKKKFDLKIYHIFR